MEVVSLFTVTDYKTKEVFEDNAIGMGQQAISYLRSIYPRFTKFVLTGFEINEVYQPVNLGTNNYTRNGR